MYKPTNAFKRIRDKLAKAQQRLARKKKFSAKWVKQKAKITRLHMRAANARKDDLHQLSSWLAKNHGVIRLEKLRVRSITASAAGPVENPGENVAAKSASTVPFSTRVGACSRTCSTTNARCRAANASLSPRRARRNAAPSVGLWTRQTEKVSQNSSVLSAGTQTTLIM
jgi:hypothetical protein